MAQTTTHTTRAAHDGCVPAQQSTPARCPTWCVGGHAGPDPQHYGAWIHEDTPHVVHTEDGDVSISVNRFDELERPWPHSTGQTTVTLAFDIDDLPIEFNVTCDEALVLLTEILDAVNRTLPLEQQTFLGQPGSEFVPDCDGPW